jgi:quercetin dioxygenase-like cupin family protein
MLVVVVVGATWIAAAQPSLEKPPHMPDIQVRVQHLDQQEVVKYGFGNIRWLMSSQIDKDAAQTFGVVTIEAGQRNMLHSHPNCEEILYVLSGACDHIVGNKKLALRPGDLIRVPAGVPHQAIVTSSEPLRAVISYSSGDRKVINYAPVE